MGEREREIEIILKKKKTKSSLVGGKISLRISYALGSVFGAVLGDLVSQLPLTFQPSGWKKSDNQNTNNVLHAVADAGHSR